MKIRLASFCLIGFFMIACGYGKTANCVEEKFSKKFNESLNYVKKTGQQGPFMVMKRLDAIIFLSVVTNKESSINDPHYPYYNTPQDFEIEVRYWEDWYKVNKCKYTISQADSLVDLYNSGRLKLE